MAASNSFSVFPVRMLALEGIYAGFHLCGIFHCAKIVSVIFREAHAFYCILIFEGKASPLHMQDETLLVIAIAILHV